MADFLAEAQAVAESAAKEAGAALLKHFRRSLTVQIKEGNFRNIVTNADKEADALIRAAISEKFPSHRIVTEEAKPKEGSDFVWYVDPLDGTNNFSRGNSQFNISIALCRENELLAGLVYNPVTLEVYRAIKDRGAFLNDKRITVAATNALAGAIICCDFAYENEERLAMLRLIAGLALKVRSLRVWGSATTATTQIAAGRVDGYARAGSSPWDYAASTLIIREAGGIVTDFSGKPWQPSSRNILAAATAPLHMELLKAVGEA
ncbi:inositol monophosphatase [Candidatus Woesearchaeota archaeon]|nr:inositol monophosphatase [Candidatus Woesearchaeota archaeon]